jgi:hypothetical protein
MEYRGNMFCTITIALDTLTAGKNSYSLHHCLCVLQAKPEDMENQSAVLHPTHQNSIDIGSLNYAIYLAYLMSCITHYTTYSRKVFLQPEYRQKYKIKVASTNQKYIHHNIKK